MAIWDKLNYCRQVDFKEHPGAHGWNLPGFRPLDIIKREPKEA